VAPEGTVTEGTLRGHKNGWGGGVGGGGAGTQKREKGGVTGGGVSKRARKQKNALGGGKYLGMGEGGGERGKSQS